MGRQVQVGYRHLPWDREEEEKREWWGNYIRVEGCREAVGPRCFLRRCRIFNFMWGVGTWGVVVLDQMGIVGTQFTWTGPADMNSQGTSQQHNIGLLPNEWKLRLIDRNVLNSLSHLCQETWYSACPECRFLRGSSTPFLNPLRKNEHPHLKIGTILSIPDEDFTVRRRNHSCGESHQIGEFLLLYHVYFGNHS